MSDPEMMDWISKASYLELLEKWRLEPLGSPWFRGEVGKCMAATFKRRQAEISPEQQVTCSKMIGWPRRQRGHYC